MVLNQWKFQCRAADNYVFRTAQTLYLKLNCLDLAGDSAFFALLRRTNDKSDCIKIFDTFESQIILVFRNNKNVLINNVYFESFILQQKYDFFETKVPLFGLCKK